MRVRIGEPLQAPFAARDMWGDCTFPIEPHEGDRVWLDDFDDFATVTDVCSPDGDMDQDGPIYLPGRVTVRFDNGDEEDADWRDVRPAAVYAGYPR